MGGSRQAAQITSKADTKAASEAALRYWHEKHGPETVTATVKDFGCHQQVDIVKDKKIIASLRYQAGAITEL